MSKSGGKGGSAGGGKGAGGGGGKGGSGGGSKPGVPTPNLPSTTGKPSGGGRGNALPSN